METWIDALNRPNLYTAGPPKLIVFSGPSGVGKGTAVRIIALRTRCTLFITPPQYFAKDLERLPALLCHANEKSKEDGRHCIVFIDEVDGILNKASSAKVNTFKAALENGKNYLGLMIILVTNHPQLLTDDVGAMSRTSHRVVFNPLTPKVLKEYIVYNFRNLEKGPHETDLSVADWTALMPTMEGQNGHTLDTWCNAVSINVTYLHLQKLKADNIIRLEDMQRVRDGLLVISEPTSKPTSIDVSTLSKDDKMEAIKDWIKKTTESNGAKGMDYYGLMDNVIYFYGGIVSREDILPDEILMCAGVGTAQDLKRIRTKTLWDKDDPLTVSVRKTFAACFRAVYKADNKVHLLHKTKDQKKYLLTRE